MARVVGASPIVRWPGGRAHADGVEVVFGTDREARVSYVGADNWWKVATTDVGGTVTDRFRVYGAIDITTVELYNDDPGATGIRQDVFHDSASPAASDVLFDLRVYGRDSGATKIQYGSMQWIVTDPAATTMDSRFDLSLQVNGVFTNLLRFTSGTFAFQNATSITTAAGAMTLFPTAGLTMALAASSPTPDNNLVHIWAATAGIITATANSYLVTETDQTTSYITLLTPNTATGVGLLAGDPEAAASGRVVYSHSTNRWEFWVNTGERARLSANTLQFQQAFTVSTSTGSLTLTSADAGVVVNSTTTQAGGSNVNAINLVPSFVETAASAGIHRGTLSQATIATGNTSNWTATVGLRAFEALLTVSGTPTGVVTGGAGFYYRNSDFTGITMTNQYGVYVETPTGATNNYGIYVAGGGTYAVWVDAGVTRLDGNALLGAAAINSGTNVLAVENGTAPTAATADQVVLYSSDNAVGNTIPSFYCEGTDVIATLQADSVSGTRVRMRINGTVVVLLGI